MLSKRSLIIRETHFVKEQSWLSSLDLLFTLFNEFHRISIDDEESERIIIVPLIQKGSS